MNVHYSDWSAIFRCRWLRDMKGSHC